jgi:hypothetical protein
VVVDHLGPQIELGELADDLVEQPGIVQLADLREEVVGLEDLLGIR